MSFLGTDFTLLVGSLLLLLVWAKQGPWVSKERGIFDPFIKGLRALPECVHPHWPDGWTEGWKHLQT